jgi:hypothetical protein
MKMVTGIGLKRMIEQKLPMHLLKTPAHLPTQGSLCKRRPIKMEEQIKVLLKPYAEEVIISYDTSVKIPAPR